jgi:cyanophycinase-like exopeptidase
VIANRAAAMDPAVAQIIRNADAIFIGGGAQGEYLDW